MSDRSGRVCVVGLGTVGLPTAALIAARGYRVVGVERSRERREMVLAGRLTEPGLDALVRASREAGRLEVTDAMVPAEVYVIAVSGTREAPWTALEEVFSELAHVAPPAALVIVETTMPPGSTRRFASALGRPDIHVAHAPERGAPGTMVAELRDLPRLVGGLTPAGTARAAAFVEDAFDGPVTRTDATTAEVAKLAENASRDVAVALADEIAAIATAIGVDPHEVRRLASQHPRVSLLRPGTGAGGPCLPKDAAWLAGAAPEVAVLLRAARAANEGQAERVAARVEALAVGTLGPVACLGATYKADVDDRRGATAAAVVDALARRLPGRVRWSDPSAAPQEGLVPLHEALDGASVVVVLVAHAAFRTLEVPAGALVVDVAGLWA